MAKIILLRNHLCVVAFILFAGGCDFPVGHQEQKKFDIAVWRSDTVSKSLMADDIISSKVLINMTKTEVIEFLGEPLNKDLDFQYLIKENTVVYDLGNSVHDPLDAEWLIISFDNDTVIKCDVVTK